MISMNELLKGKRIQDQSEEIQNNLSELLEKINKIRTAYNKPMNVTSGLRTREDQIRVYAQKGITDESKIPFGSKHLAGLAVDISDPHKELQDWCENNIEVLEEVGVWCEDFKYTSNWCHFQVTPPVSGKRFFKP